MLAGKLSVFFRAPSMGALLRCKSHRKLTTMSEVKRNRRREMKQQSFPALLITPLLYGGLDYSKKA